MLVPDPAGPGGERVKLLDFGIAKLGEDFRGLDESHTRTGVVIGTVGYMSPEQLQGDKVDGHSDVYSLGVVLYRALTGHLPFVSDKGPLALATMHLVAEPPPLSQLVPAAPEWLCALVQQMLRKPRAWRPAMSEVAARLQEHLPVGPPVRVTHLSGRSRSIAAAETTPASHPTLRAPLPSPPPLAGRPLGSRPSELVGRLVAVLEMGRQQRGQDIGQRSIRNGPRRGVSLVLQRLRVGA